MQVIEKSEITQEDLLGLFNGGLAAVRVPGYYSTEQSKAITQVLLNSTLHGKYENAPNIGRVGQAFFESQANEKLAQRYEKEAVKWIRELREGFSPNLTPIDRFRLEVDELWPHGANVAKMKGRKMFVGLARTFGQGSRAEPHQDMFHWDAPESVEANVVSTQIAMNVYLHLPDDGGELILWPVSYNRNGYEERRIPGSYGLREETLPEPVATLHPRLGELILFNATKVHSVGKIKAGARVSWSCFVGYQGTDAPLVLWS
jgi:hypothetical protein